VRGKEVAVLVAKGLANVPRIVGLRTIRLNMFVKSPKQNDLTGGLSKAKKFQSADCGM